MPVGITREGDWVRADDAIAALDRGAASRRCPRPARRPPAPRSSRCPPSPRRSTTTAGRRPPAAARPPRRGRHGAGDARAGRRALRRLRRARPRRCAWTSSRPRTCSPPTASRRSRGSACATPSRPTPAPRSTAAGLRYPLFVKPANLGSSVGVTKVARRRRRWPTAVALAAELRRVDRRRGGRRRPRDRGGRARQRRAAGVGARRDRARPRVLRLRGQVPRRRRRAAHPGRPARRGVDRRGPARSPSPAFTGAALRRHGPRRLLLRGGRPRPPAQRGQHDPRLHPDLDVPEAVGGVAASPYDELIDELVRLALERHDRRRRFSTKR